MIYHAMAPPSVLSSYKNVDKKCQSNLLLSPFPSFSNCITPSLFSDHIDAVTNVDAVHKTSLDACFDISQKNNEVMTREVNRMFPCQTLSNCGESKVNNNVFHDVPLVSDQESSVSNNADFLQGLDDIDFDFDDMDANGEISADNNLQSFIDETIDDAMDNSFVGDHEVSMEEGDVYKKEFYMKHLNLQPSSPRRMQGKSRKRKHEESECTSSSPPHISIPFQYPTSSFTIPNRNTSQLQCPTSQASPTSPSLRVPSKLCSCATNDWKQTILYSTAKSSSVMSVRTSPSTATSVTPNKLFAGISSSSVSQLNNGRISPTSFLSQKSYDCVEFDLLSRGEIDEDTEELLEWLDDSENVQTAVTGSGSLSNQSSGVSSRLSSESDSSCHEFDVDDLEAMLSPKSQQPSWKLDSFIDLESYVSDNSSTSKDAAFVTKSPVDSSRLVQKDSVEEDGLLKSNLRLSILSDISRNVHNTIEYNERKDAIKRDILKSCYSQDTRNRTNQTVENHNFDYESDTPFVLLSTRSTSSSPSSPGSSSSSLSSPVLAHDASTHSKNLGLLDLFADENAAWRF